MSYLTHHHHHDIVYSWKKRNVINADTHGYQELKKSQKHVQTVIHENGTRKNKMEKKQLYRCPRCDKKKSDIEGFYCKDCRVELATIKGTTKQ